MTNTTAKILVRASSQQAGQHLITINESRLAEVKQGSEVLLTETGELFELLADADKETVVNFNEIKDQFIKHANKKGMWFTQLDLRIIEPVPAWSKLGSSYE